MPNQPDLKNTTHLSDIFPNEGSVRLQDLRRRASQLRRLRQWCRAALATAHLTEVARLLHQKLDATDDDLDALGLPVNLLQLFPRWREGRRTGFRAPDLGLRPAPMGAGQPIGGLRLQLTPSSESASLALILLRDLLRATDPAVSIHVMVQPGANLSGLAELALSFSPDAGRRVRFVEGLTSTVFSQDNALPGRDRDGEPALLIPREFLRGTIRAGDELTRDAAERMFGVRVVASRLHWQGGNLVCDGERHLIGVDTIGENMARLGLTAGEVAALFEGELGCPVVPMGDLTTFRYDADRGSIEASGQAEFHIDFDIALLGRFGRKRKPRALVADPALGIDLMPRVLERRSLISGHFVPPDEARQLIEAEYVAFAAERHPRLLGYAETLEGLGYEVVGLPDLRMEMSEKLFSTVNLDFGYCNVLPGLNRGRPAVHFLPFGLTELDRTAVERYRKAGVVPVRASRNPRVANTLMSLRGGLRCFCGRVS